MPTDPGYGLGVIAYDSVAFIDSEIPAIDVISVMLNQRQKADGTLYDVQDIGFRIPPYFEVFYVHPDAEKNWAKIALHSITLKATKVLSIYAGYPYRQDVIPLINPLPDDYPDGVIPTNPPPPLPVS